MSAPQIPNLLTMRGNSSSSRGTRGGARGRGRGRGGPSNPPGQSDSVNPTDMADDPNALVRRFAPGLSLPKPPPKPTGIPQLVYGGSSGHPKPRLDDDGPKRFAAAGPPPTADPDKIVRLTDWDATMMRQSAHDAGLLDDEYVKYFTLKEIPRRYPIINRGTYVRTTAIDRLITSWLQSHPRTPKQVISLGAGSDTRYFRLNETPRLLDRCLWHEFDFPEIGRAKLQAINNTEALSPSSSNFFNLKQDPDTGEFGFLSELVSTGQKVAGYMFHPCDLRKLPKNIGEVTGEGSKGKGFRDIMPEYPTLIVSECCLCYLEPEVADHALRFFSEIPQNVAMVLYEPILPSDDFGRMMTQNLASRGIKMPTVHKYETLQAQGDRLKELGMVKQRASDVDFLWEKWVTKDEKNRINRVEMMDEVEEWKLLSSHYAVVWGWRENDREKEKSPSEEGWSFFGKWERFPDQLTGAGKSIFGGFGRPSGPKSPFERPLPSPFTSSPPSPSPFRDPTG